LPGDHETAFMKRRSAIGRFGETAIGDWAKRRFGETAIGETVREPDSASEPVL